jgi:hypothetical protein
MTSAWASRACSNPEAPDLRRCSGLALGSCLASDASQGPGIRRQALSYRGLGAPLALLHGHGIASHFPDKVTHEA